jgi:hypothetical protein
VLERYQPSERSSDEVRMVAEELLSSLEESDEEVATAWAAELEWRSRHADEGRVQTISWEPRGQRF